MIHDLHVSAQSRALSLARQGPILPRLPEDCHLSCQGNRRLGIFTCSLKLFEILQYHYGALPRYVLQMHSGRGRLPGGCSCANYFAEFHSTGWQVTLNKALKFPPGRMPRNTRNAVGTEMSQVCWSSSSSVLPAAWDGLFP